eukprot:Hpha_TRINITY_DN16471_c0_g1::TRINITY_DN16471_c0_g1_i1::g.159507::m.159507
MGCGASNSNTTGGSTSEPVDKKREDSKTNISSAEVGRRSKGKKGSETSSSKYTAGENGARSGSEASSKSAKSEKSGLGTSGRISMAADVNHSMQEAEAQMMARPRSKSLLAQDVEDEPEEGHIERKRTRGSFRRRSRRSISNSYNGVLPDWWTDTSKTQEEKLGMLFDVLDEDKGGTIDLQELTKGLQSLGFAHSTEQVTQMFALADVDGGGDIDRDEFSRFFKGLMVDEEDSEEESPGRTATTASVIAASTPLLQIRTRPVGSFIRPVKGLKTTIFTGAPSRIKCVAMGSSFRGFFACDRQETQLHLLDSTTGTELRTYTGHQDAIMSVSVACTGKHIVTAGRDGVLIIWDTTCGSIVKEIEHPGAVTCCVFSPDARCVITGCQDNLVRRWNARCGKVVACSDLQAAGRGGIVLSLAHSPDYLDGSQQLLAVTRSRDVSVFIMCATTLRQLCSLPGHSAMLWNVSFACDRKMLLSACENDIRVWDTTQANHVHLLSAFPVTAVPGGDGNVPVKTAGGRIWTTAMFCNGDFSHVFVGACSSSSVLFMHATEGTVLASITVKAPVYCMSAGLGNDSCMGDEFGNLYRFELC